MIKGKGLVHTARGVAQQQGWLVGLKAAGAWLRWQGLVTQQWVATGAGVVRATGREGEGLVTQQRGCYDA